jgi:4-hydroxybenzoate polyprenyltransferase
LLVGTGTLAFAGLALAAAQLIWQVATLDINDEAGCLRHFKSNMYAGLLIALGLLVELLL